MVGPELRRRAVEHLKTRSISERRACRLIRFSRSAVRRHCKGRNDGVMCARLKALAQQYPRYGNPTPHDMLVREGKVVNRKRTYRIYREEGLQVRTKKRSKMVPTRIPMLVPNAIGERWSIDFVSDQLANGRRFRVINVVDDYSRECVLQIVDFSISGERVVRELERLHRQLPTIIVFDNGPDDDRSFAHPLQPCPSASITGQQTTHGVRQRSCLICSIPLFNLAIFVGYGHRSGIW